MADQMMSGTDLWFWDSNPDTKISATYDMKDMIDQVVDAEERDGSWYHKALAAVGSDFSVRDHYDTVMDDLKPADLEEYLNKPLPIEDYLNKPLPSTPGHTGFDVQFADAGIDARAYPQFVGSTEEHVPTYQNLRDIRDSEDLPDYDPSTCAYPTRAILNPKSQKSKYQSPPKKNSKSQRVNAAAVDWTPINIHKCLPTPPNQFDLFEQPTSKKRSNRDTLDDSPMIYDYDISPVATKKIRVTEQQDDYDSDIEIIATKKISDSDIEIIAATTCCIEFPPTPPCEDDDCEYLYTVPSPPRKRKIPVLTGYPGQFESYEVAHLRRRTATILVPERRTNGDPLHPNGEFTHTNFIDDPTYPYKDYTKAMLNSLPTRNVALNFADFQMDLAAEDPTRTKSEEKLRREAHLECTSARLEGVSVGQFRYYQGHMSIEEYMAAKMCICWDDCWCNKLCTIYADVMCPCTESIVLHD
ncbi:hypothetical protein LTR67_000877 [Exophiala xenobiotica]